jgi:4-diphosphocytidyl-2-C-methyl-D-erythritol kinase
MILFPPAKINLGLKVLFKRNDGYHELETVMIQIPYTDILEILPADKFEFIQSGLVIDGDTESNLCVKAFRLLQKAFSIPNVSIHLKKLLPMGAGLGGGSADAAYVIRGLNELFNLNLSIEEMQNFASQLGSDCPFFIIDRPQLAKGRGELLSEIEIDLKGYYVKLVNIGIHVSTKEAYSNVHFSAAQPTIKEILTTSIESWRDNLMNDFEVSILKAYPELEKIKNQIYDEGALYAAMSGSGSTMFGIYKEEPSKTFQQFNPLLEEVMLL